MPELYPLNVENQNGRQNLEPFLVVNIYSRARHMGTSPDPGPGPLVPAGPGPDWSRESRREIPPVENAEQKIS